MQASASYCLRTYFCCISIWSTTATSSKACCRSAGSWSQKVRYATFEIEWHVLTAIGNHAVTLSTDDRRLRLFNDGTHVLAATGNHAVTLSTHDKRLMMFNDSMQQSLAHLASILQYKASTTNACHHIETASRPLCMQLLVKHCTFA